MNIRNLFTPGKSNSPADMTYDPFVRRVKKYAKHIKPQADPDSMVRGFTAGEKSDLNFDWYSPESSINSLLTAELSLMKARSRERARNDTYAAGFIRSFQSNVIGNAGIRMQSTITNTDGSSDSMANEAVETQWKLWTKYAKYTDITHGKNWRDILSYLMSLYATDGEIFIRHIDGADNRFGYSIQVLDSSACDEKLNIPSLDNGNKVQLGIEYDEWERPVAYYFKATNGVKLLNGTYKRLDAKDVIHYFEAKFPNQKRGIPLMAAAISKMKMLDGFENAALVNARAGAAKMGFFTQTEPGQDDPAEHWEDESGELVEELTPGLMSLLPQGVGFSQFDTKFPENTIETFSRKMLRAVATGLGIDYPTLGNDLSSVNLASARIGITETREIWKGIQQSIIDNIITPIFEKWLAHSLSRSLILINGTAISIRQLPKFSKCQFTARRWAYTDPNRDANAHLQMANGRIKALSSIASELGIDFEQEVQKIARDESLLQKHGIARVPKTTPPEPFLESIGFSDEDSK